MEKNVFKTICGTVNYNEYHRIQNTLLASSFALCISNHLTSTTTAKVIIATTASLTFFTSYMMMTSKGSFYTKDVKQIYELYQEFLNNYNKLNKTFELNNPIEIHKMYNYLLENGYLSKDKHFFFSNENVKDIKCLNGVDTITGSSVCRHISAMLTDILNNYGIEASQVGVYVDDNYTFNNSEALYKSMEMFLNNIPEEEIKKSDVLKEIAQEIKLHQKEIANLPIESNCEKIKDKRNIFDRKYGNHSITYAYKDGKSYYLDPTQNRIYRLNEQYNNQLYDEYGQLLIKFKSSLVLSNNSLKKNRMYKHLCDGYDCISKDEENEMIEKTLEKCYNNADIFDKFYDDNKELYNEISNKVLKIKNTYKR